MGFRFRRSIRIGPGLRVKGSTWQYSNRGSPSVTG
jgi:hypothetical protein